MSAAVMSSSTVTIPLDPASAPAAAAPKKVKKASTKKAASAKKPSAKKAAAKKPSTKKVAAKKPSAKKAAAKKDSAKKSGKAAAPSTKKKADAKGAGSKRKRESSSTKKATSKKSAAASSDKKKSSTKKKKKATTGKKRVAKKKKVDPNVAKFKGVADTMPSHANTGWMLFSQHRRETDPLLQAMKFGEVGKITAVEWRQMRNVELAVNADGNLEESPIKNADGSDMKPTEVYLSWMAKEEEDKVRYQADRAKMTDLQKEFEEHSHKQKKKKKRANDKVLRANGKPVRPLSQYMFFVKERRAEIVERHQAEIVEKYGADKLFPQIGKKLGDYWRQLTSFEEGDEAAEKLATEARAPFEALNQDDILRYQSQLFGYNTKLMANHTAELATISAEENGAERAEKYEKKHHKAYLKWDEQIAFYSNLPTETKTRAQALVKVHVAEAAAKAKAEAEAAAIVAAAKQVAKAAAAAEAAAAAAAEESV